MPYDLPDIPIRRSLLLVPAAGERSVEWASGVEADVLVIDLDGTGAPQREGARRRVRALLERAHAGDLEVAVRPGRLASPHGAGDLALLADGPRPDLVIAPRVESAAELRAIEAALGGPDAPPLVAGIDSARGVAAAYEIAGASGRLVALMVGSGELLRDLRGRAAPDRLPLAHALGAVILAARACGLEAYDAPADPFHDLEAVAREARLSRDLGFDGKAALHPAQVPAIHEAFTPSAAEMAEAEEIIGAVSRARPEERGSIAVRGRLVERHHVEAARRVLSIARALRAA